MEINLKHKIGKGLQPQPFIDGMSKNKSSLMDGYNRFAWSSKGDEDFFAALREQTGLKCLILCTDWCPDVIWNVPVLFRVLEQGRIYTEVLLMEEHLETIDHFLTDGGRGQPIAVFIDSNGMVFGKWGPRPQYIQAVMEQFRRENPDREASDYQEKVEKARSEVADMYNAGTGYQSVIVLELRKLIESFI
ncbi:thioredoxin family protein [Cohnella sp.]|uniref:thioredoxin family protein n=1 Tax=Cohnella sp. TaxID=1883426 RepID=UPI00356A7B71